MDEKAGTDARITGFPVSIGSAALAALFLVAIAPLVLAQALGRMVLFAVPDTNEMAGFCLAASMFLALGPTLRAGTHVRVTIGLFRLKAGPRRVVEAVTLLAATGLGGRYLLTDGGACLGKLVIRRRLAGHLAFPLWIPQAAMALGLLVFTIATVEALVDRVRGRDPACRRRGDRLERIGGDRGCS